MSNSKVGRHRPHPLGSACFRRDKGGSRGGSSQPSAKRPSGRSQTLKNNLCASPRWPWGKRRGLVSRRAARAIETAIEKVLKRGCRTPDIPGRLRSTTTSRMGDMIAEATRKILKSSKT